MTIEEAREIFINRGYEQVDGGSIYNPDKWRESVIVISDWLQQASVDAVSRADAIEVVDHMLMGERNHKIVALEELKQLPSVQPKQKTGRWIASEISNEKYVCSECGGACWYYDHEGNVAKSRYCPNCGAEMEVKK